MFDHINSLDIHVRVKMMPRHQNNQFPLCQLDFDPMVLILELDLDMVNIYHNTKIQRHTDTQADRKTQTPRKYYLTHIRGR